jgi:hypothetical protein
MRDELADSRRRFLFYFSSVGLGSTLLPGALWAQGQGQSNVAPKITLEMLKTAERIAGLEFTDAERDLLLDGVNQHLAKFETMRTIPPPNSVPSCLRFSPITPGSSIPCAGRSG